jgi:hypothetical protein
MPDALLREPLRLVDDCLVRGSIGGLLRPDFDSYISSAMRGLEAPQCVD